MSSTVILGVGRSGTTALYALVQKLLGPSQPPFHSLYEPFLWRPEVFDRPFAQVGHDFGSIESVSIEGMYHHLRIPLLGEGPIDARDLQWLKSTLNPSEDGTTLIKTIRSCGRIPFLTQAIARAKYLFVMRNPLDVMNSIMSRFSFLGPPYHRSDWNRLRRAAEKRFPQDPVTQELSEETDRLGQELAYWYWMNRIALESLLELDDPTLVLPYHVFKRERERAIRAIAHFLALPVIESLIDDRASVGPTTPSCWLRTDEVDRVLPFLDIYLGWLEALGEKPEDDFEPQREHYLGSQERMNRDDRLLTRAPMNLIHQMRAG